MPTVNLKERFLELPLFQGMTRADIAEAFDWLRPARISCSKDRVIVFEGDVCNQLFFVLDGSVNIITAADDHGYTLTEKLSAPDIIQPESTFGFNQHFTCTVAASSNCELVGIDKLDVVRMSDKYEIFRLNLLNIICTRAQRRNRVPWRTKPVGVRKKIVRFLEDRCLRPAGSKTLEIKMERLGCEIGESRLNVSRTLNAMNAEGVIRLRRSEIHVPALELLIRQTSSPR